ncbi:unnamed protein product [Prunus armeniaca]
MVVVVVVVVVKEIKVKVVVVGMVEEELVEVEKEAVAVMLEVVVVCGGGVHLFDVCSCDDSGIDNLRPKLLISKQANVNLGEEYLPSGTAFYKTQEGKTNSRKTKRRQNCGLFSLKGAEVAGLEDY